MKRELHFNKAILFGWNGCQNVGDDAMTQVILAQLTRMAKIKEILIWGDAKTIVVDKMLDVKDVGGVKGLNCVYSLPGIRTWYGEGLLVKKYLKNIDLILVGGGSIFHSLKGMQHLLNRIEFAKKKNPEVKVLAVSVSAGPWHNIATRDMAIKLFNAFDRMAVRDQTSAERLSLLALNTRIKYFPDIALSYPIFKNVEYKLKALKNNRIGISLRAGYVVEPILLILKVIFSYLDRINQNVEVYIFEFCDHASSSDRNESPKIEDLLAENSSISYKIIPYDENPWSFYEQVRAVDYMFCMRLHSAVISYAVRTSFMTIPYANKCVDFAKSVLNLSDDYLIYQTDTVQEVYNKVSNFIQCDANIQFESYHSVLKESSEQMKYLLSE